VPGYAQCSNVGVGGVGEHCECNETEQVVGQTSSCDTNWDVSGMLYCAGETGLCAWACKASAWDPYPCSQCLTMTDCGDEVCDFITSCDPEDIEEELDMVFTDFGGC